MRIGLRPLVHALVAAGLAWAGVARADTTISGPITFGTVFNVSGAGVVGVAPGVITNSMLANPSLTLGSTVLTLGATVTSVTGLTLDTANNTFKIAGTPITAITGATGTLVSSDRTISTSGPLAGGGDLSANRTLSITGGIGKVLAGVAPAFTATPVLGINGTTAGSIGLANGGASGATVTIQNPGATAAYNFNLPAGAGSAGQVLTSAGGGSSAQTWTTLAAVATSASASDLTAGTLAAARGGAGTLSGILKANGAGVVSAAVSGTDYAPATSGSSVLLGNGTGGFSSYAGTSCTNKFPRSLSAAGAATCASVANADLVNSSLTLGSTAISLGGTASTIAGLTLSGATLSGTTTLNGSGSIDASGDLGLGTAATTRRLTLKASAGLDTLTVDYGTSLGGNGGIEIQNRYNGATDIAGVKLIATASNAGQVLLSTNNAGGGLTARMVVTEPGNVGIGTLSPNYLVQMHGASGIHTLLQFTNATTGSTAGDGSYIGVLNGGTDLWINNQEGAAVKIVSGGIEQARWDGGGGFYLNNLITTPGGKQHLCFDPSNKQVYGGSGGSC